MSNESAPKCPQCGAALPANAPAGLCPNCLMALNLKTETVLTDDALPTQPPLPPEQLAPHFPQLEILECLGRGGMGVVYKARQKTLNRFVALKLLAPERVNDPKFAERFTREAQALAALNHPNIVTIHDFGQAGGFYFLLMEFVDGVNLRQLLRVRTNFSPEEALTIVPVLCDALQYAHEHGIVHRDIKPENILLDKSGRVKVADFGIARMLGNGNGDGPGQTAPMENATQNAIGTPGYIAPEQKTDPRHVDNRADIYSLGVVFYEMLTGEAPGKRIEPPSKRVQIDVRLDAVVLRALEKTPEMRWQTAADLRTQLEIIAATPDTPARQLPAKSPLVRAFESYYGFTFTSPIAIRVGNFSMFALIGLVGLLSMIQGLEKFAGFYGFFGFFGFLGLAYIMDCVANKKTPGGAFSHPALKCAACVVIALQLLIAAQIINNYLETEAPRIQLLEQNDISSPAISHWSNMVHLRRYLLIPLTVAGFCGAVLFAGLAFQEMQLRTQRNQTEQQKGALNAMTNATKAAIAIIVAAVVLAVIAMALITGTHHAHRVTASQNSSGSSASAEENNSSSVKVDSEDSQIEAKAGWQLWQQRKLDKAGDMFNKAVQSDPNNADAWNGLGWVAFNTGNPQDAEDDFKKALSLDPKQAAALNGLGQIYLGRKKYDEAEKYFLQVPQAPAAWYGLARIYLLEGKFDDAEKWAQKIVDSGQADQTANAMLRAAKNKELPDALRILIEPQ